MDAMVAGHMGHGMDAGPVQQAAINTTTGIATGLENGAAMAEEPEFKRILWMDFAAVCEQIIFFKKPVYLELHRLGAPVMRQFLAGLT